MSVAIIMHPSDSHAPAARVHAFSHARVGASMTMHYIYAHFVFVLYCACICVCVGTRT